MQDDSGLKKILTFGWVYDLFHYLIGTRKAKLWIAENIWKCEQFSRVVDLGCGTGRVLDYLPENINYTGVDISEEYIEFARSRYGDKAEFLVGTAEQFLSGEIEMPEPADIVLCSGLLHHLSEEEALWVLELSKKILKPTGRLICNEPTYLRHQGWISRWVTSLDRGQNVRTESGWKSLISEVYEEYRTSILTGMIRIPYVHIVIEATLKRTH